MKDEEGIHSGGREREDSSLAWDSCDRVQWTHSVRGCMGTLRVGLVQLDGEQNYCEVRWVVWEYHRFGLGQGGFGV